jgi:hypothetical protein
MSNRNGEHDENRGRRRSRSVERQHEVSEDRHCDGSRGQNYRHRRGTQQEKQESEDLVSGANKNSRPDPRFQMTGGAGPPRVTIPHSRTPSASHSNSSSHSIYHERNNCRHEQRFDSKGKPLVRGKRGWRDASIGPAPKYKLKLGSTMGLDAFVKEKFQWGKKDMNWRREKKRGGQGALWKRGRRRDLKRKTGAVEKRRQVAGAGRRVKTEKSGMMKLSAVFSAAIEVWLYVNLLQSLRIAVDAISRSSLVQAHTLAEVHIIVSAQSPATVLVAVPTKNIRLEQEPTQEPGANAWHEEKPTHKTPQLFRLEIQRKGSSSMLLVRGHGSTQYPKIESALHNGFHIHRLPCMRKTPIVVK